MLNSIVLLGRLTGTPELRSTPSGVAVCAFNIAVDRDYTGQSGEKQTDFISIVAWRQTAEFVCRYFSKGQMIALQGSLQSRKYRDKYGNDRTAWEVIASHVWFTEKKNESGAGSDEKRSEAGIPRDVASEAYTNGADEDFTPLPDDDLPF